MNKSELYDYRYQSFIKTKYLSPTNNRPSRVRATNVSSGETIVISWDHCLDTPENHLAACRALYSELEQEQPKRFLGAGTEDSSGYIFTARD